MKIIKFGAEWCAGCKDLTKTLDTMQLDIPVETIDIDVDVANTVKYGIRALPTMLLVDENNNVLRRVVGAVTPARITEFING